MKKIMILSLSILKEKIKNYFSDPGQRKGLIQKIVLLAIVFSGMVLVARTGFNSDIDIDKRMYSEPALVDNSKLRIVQAAPSGELAISDRKKEVTVVFNHPMKPLGTLDKVTEGAFAISPGIRGKFRWYGSRICAFTPEEGWEYGRTYKISVTKGSISLNGKKLEKDFSFSFTIKIPDINLSLRPLGYGYSYDTIDYKQSFLLRSNLPLDINDIKRDLNIVSKGSVYLFKAAYYEHKKDQGYYFYYDTTDPEIKHKYIVLTPQKNFPRNREVLFKIRKGLYAKKKAGRLKSDFIKKFTTHGPLKVSFKNESSYYQDLYYTKLVFNNSIDLAQAYQNISISPKASWRGRKTGKTRYLPVTNWKLKPGETYTLTVKPFKDIHGNMLTQPGTFSFTVPNVRMDFNLEDSYKTILESKMKPHIPVYLSNMGSISISTAPVDLDSVQDTLTDRRRHSIIQELSFTKQAGWETGFGSNRMGTAAFNVAPYLNMGTGWLAVRFEGEVEGYNGKKRKQNSVQLIQATDLGLTVKNSYNKTLVWIHSLSDGTPVSGAEVTLYDGDSRIGSGSADREGMVSIAHGNTIEKPLIVAAKGNDRAFVTERNYGMYMPYVCDNFDRNAHDPVLYGQIIFDRKLYRPGDSVRFKAILAEKKEGKLTPVGSQNVQVSISSSRGEEVLSLAKMTSEEGGVWGSFDIPEDAPLGHYSVNVKFGEKRGYYVNETFQVEEFRPVAFSVNIEGMGSSMLQSKNRISIIGKYLFGAPLKDAPVEYSFYRKEKRIYLSNYSGYTFGDGSLWEYGATDWSEAGHYFSGRGTLDKKGEHSFTFDAGPLAVSEKIDSPTERTISLSQIYDVKLEAKVSDKSAKSVTKTSYSRVYPGSRIIGIRPERRFQGMDNEFVFDLLSLTKEGKAATAKATVYIIHNEYKSILSRGPGGTVQPRNTLVKTLVKEDDITLKGVPVKYTFKADKTGTYTILVKDKESPSFSRDSFFTWGGSSYFWFPDDSDRITLIPDKIEYLPGEKARVLIQSPFRKCKAIVTLERESVIWQKTIDIQGNGTPVEIPIRKEYLPNVYLSVILVRPRIPIPEGISQHVRKQFVENDLGAPRFRAGIVKLSVSNSSQRMSYSVRTDKKTYGPGDRMQITFKADPFSEIAISLADRAVLDLIDYHYADPVNKFYQNWPDGVKIFENRRYIIKQRLASDKGDSPGGQGKGDELSGVGGFRGTGEDGARKDIRYTAFWKPGIRCDRDGEASITVKLPDNLTTFRLMSIAARKGRYARVEKEFIVKKPVVVQKNLPRFLRPGDTVDAGALVTNQTDIDARFSFSITSGLLKGADTKTVKIPAGETREVTFPVRLNLAEYRALKNKSIEDKGKTKLAIKGILKVAPADQDLFTSKGYKVSDIRDSITFEIPVKEVHPEEAFSISGLTTASEKEYLTIPGKDEILPYLGSLDISFSATALTGLDRGFKFFMANPYFCLEQRASAFLLAITSGKLLERFRFEPPAKMEYDFSKIGDLFLDELSGFRNSDGGFRPWKDSSSEYGHPYLTAYVLYVLETAKGRGYKVDEGVMSSAADYLRRYLSRPSKDSFSFILESMAMIHYVFSLRGEYDPSLTNFLMQHSKDLSIRGHARLAMAISMGTGTSDYKKDSSLEKIHRYIINNMEVTTRKVFFKEPPGGFTRAFYTRGSTAAAVLRMLMMIDRNNPMIPGIVSYIVADSAVWGDSHGSAFCAAALHDYSELFERSGDGSFNGMVSLNRKKIVSKKLSVRSSEIETFTMPVQDIYSYGTAGKTYPLEFVSGGKNNRLYYTASLRYHPAKGADDPRDEGIEVIREYVDLGTDRPVVKNSAFKRGQIYLCRVRVTTGKPCYNFVLSAPIPSTMEIVNTAFSTESGSLSGFVTRDPVYIFDFWWAMDIVNTEYRDDRAIITQEYLSPGMHEYTFLVRPLVKGDALEPPVSAKLMYEPEIFGRTGSSRSTVR